MLLQILNCPSCAGQLVIDMDVFRLNQSPGNLKLHVKCPLCGNGVFFGSIRETYEETQDRETNPAPGDASSSESEVSTSGGGFGASSSASASGGDQRSNVKNPNNAAHRAAADNRSNQMNPNNPASKSSRGTGRR